MMAGVKILELGPGVSDRRIRRIATRRHAGGVNRRVLGVAAVHLAAIGCPGVGDRVLRVETGSCGGDLHRVWRKNRVRRSRGGAGKWRVVVAAQIEYESRRQADAVPLGGVPGQKYGLVGVVNVVHLRQADAEQATDGQIGASAGAHAETPLRPVRTAMINGAYEQAGEGRERV